MKRLGIAIDRSDRWGGSEALDRVPPRVHGPDRGAWASHDPMVPKEALRVRAKSAPGSGRAGVDATRIRDYVLCMVAC